MATSLKHLNQRAKGIFSALVSGLKKPGDHQKIDNGGDGIMAVSVEIIGECPHGTIVAVAHYYEQNGDLMADPDMTFLICPGGQVVPMTFQQDNLAIYQRAVEIHEDGKIEFYRRMQTDITKFANDWMRNIKQQQFAA